MTDYLTDDQISYIVHGYQKRTMSHSMFLIRLIIADCISYRNSLVLKLRIKDGMTYQKIADIIGVSRERARQIFYTVLRTIRCQYPRYKKKYFILKEII